MRSLQAALPVAARVDLASYDLRPTASASPARAS
jgi:hypothetical protein